MLLNLDFGSNTPIYMQIRNQIVVGIASGELKSGEKLPTIRGLAEESGINMMTVSKAYQLLKSEGYIETDRRSGAIVKGKQIEQKLDNEAMENLDIIAAQAKLGGIAEEEFLFLCKKAYEKGEDR